MLVNQYERILQNDVNGYVQADVMKTDEDKYTFTPLMVTRDMMYEQYNTVMNRSYLLHSRDPQTVK